MKCNFCGQELKEKDKYCPNCGKKVEIIKDNSTKIVLNNNDPYYEEQYIKGLNNDTTLCIASLICAYAIPIISIVLENLSRLIPPLENFFGYLSGILWIPSLAALPLAIYAKVKYPQSTFAKVLIIVYLLQFILGILAVVILTITCINSLRDCVSLGLIFSWL